MIKLVIIADDLTGALDTGVQFSKKNISTIVTADLNFNTEEISKDADVIVIDTESRHISAVEAKKRVKSVLSKFDKKKIKFFYKKTDSTLRGNIGSEIEGFMEGLDINEVSFIPAFPLNKRTVKDGILYVNDVKLSETQFAMDILNPVTDSFIPNIINKQSNINVEIKDINTDFPSKIDKEKNIYIFDSQNMEDMENIGKILYDKNKLNYTIGNAGFAEILTYYIKTDTKKEDIVLEDNKVLFVCGSVNITSLKQCKYAEKTGYCSDTLNFNDIILENYKSSDNYINTKEYFKEKINNNNKFLLKTSDSEDVIKKAIEYTEKNSISMENLTSNIANSTGQLVSDLIKEQNIRNMIVFGGDTLIGILKNIKCQYIIPVSEIFPGVVFTKAVGKETAINVITKAGGFGEENIIERINEFLENHSI
ncbi:four-carbon acid sugar kinase family protein [Fusobacterium varium]|uniref:four-carbon acid sugar kinase family protein n=1 Tax=Fusobacterium varium TaxID=856 RepID=UPI000E4CD8D4|nr:four-carbon acid sugar kinase family protein [Fusobacterium varium]RHG38748.1 four-carbon acid sugar kinase family protein [Fusobacterium varium]